MSCDLERLRFNIKMLQSIRGGLRFPELAAKAGVQEPVLFAIEDLSAWPTAEDLSKIAGALDTTSSVLLNEVRDEETLYGQRSQTIHLSGLYAIKGGFTPVLSVGPYFKKKP